MLPYLRAALLESLRLWPTTPVILRQSTRETEWDGATLPKGANVIVFAPFFHRDDGLPFAHRFAPELWLVDPPQGGERPVRTAVDGGRGAGAVLLRPGALPGLGPRADARQRDAGAIVAARTPRLEEPGRLDADAPMPGLLDNYTLAFRLEPAGA
jgi:hypothetical protein